MWGHSYLVLSFTILLFFAESWFPPLLGSKYFSVSGLVIAHVMSSTHASKSHCNGYLFMSVFEVACSLVSTLGVVGGGGEGCSYTGTYLVL